MSSQRDERFLRGLLDELRRLPHETEWVEFKVNNEDPEMIGHYISALANSAILREKAHGYLIWGVDNKTHELRGTKFQPQLARKGNEPLSSYLLHMLEPKIRFDFHQVQVEGHHIVILEVERAVHLPVRFHGDASVRVGQVTKKLKDVPELERQLWRLLDATPFEKGIAVENISADEVLRLLDAPAYFSLLSQTEPLDPLGRLETLAADELVSSSGAGGWNITNLGAILFARNLDDFDGLKRKALRIIHYNGKGRTETHGEILGENGYASGFEALIKHLSGILPSNEVVQLALRKTVPMFPDLALRELVANALIHQDFSITGVGPMVEIFDDRIEITNPGEPLVDTQRFVDTPPKSRNEALAALMRRFGICEERGSGIDKVVFQVELFQLPAPLFESPTGFTRAVLFAHKPYTAMDRDERTRACYLHACLKWVQRDYLTNASLRERFKVAERNKAMISRYIKEAVDDKWIEPFDEEAGKKLRKYVPFWARSVD